MIVSDEGEPLLFFLEILKVMMALRQCTRMLLLRRCFSSRSVFRKSDTLTCTSTKHNRPVWRKTRLSAATYSTNTQPEQVAPHVTQNDTEEFLENLRNLMSSLSGRDKLVVLGTGWGSYAVLQDIDKSKYDVIVVSPRNHFLFTPLLASTTVGTLEFR